MNGGGTLVANETSYADDNNLSATKIAVQNCLKFKADASKNQ
jgi:hypothetical protein